jgi:hypothetical protein
MTTKRASSPFDLCKFEFTDGRGGMPGNAFADTLLLARNSWVGLKSCHGPSTAQPDAPNYGAEEKIGPLRSG